MLKKHKKEIITMKKNKAIIWGVLILIAGVGLLVFAFQPQLAVFTVPVWKWIAAALLVYWLVHKIVFGRKITTKLTVFLPLALLFMVFEKEIGALIGRGPDFVNNWIILLAAVLLNVAVYFIFRGKNPSKNKAYISYKNGKITSGCAEDDTRSTGASQKSARGGDNTRSFRMGDNVFYVDASRPSASVSNKLGSLNIYYQNTDVGDLSSPLELNVTNSLGATEIHIPRNWHVELNEPANSMGSVECRPDGAVTIRTITINIENNMGSVEIVSDD